LVDFFNDISSPAIEFVNVDKKTNYGDFLKHLQEHYELQLIGAVRLW